MNNIMIMSNFLLVTNSKTIAWGRHWNGKLEKNNISYFVFIATFHEQKCAQHCIFNLSLLPFGILKWKQTGWDLSSKLFRMLKKSILNKIL